MANNKLLATDSFTSGSLAAGWTAINGLAESQLTSTPFYAEPAATTTQYGQQYTGTSFPNDHCSEVTVHTLTSEVGTVLSLHVRMQSGVYSGYQIDITNGTALFYVVTAGAKTQVGSTKTGLTFAANDVWSLTAAGSAFVLYQNSSECCFFGDATYTGGCPGFSQASTVGITHTQVASWRGYSGVTQNGIWTKQGIMFSAIASELTGSVRGIQNPDFLYETGPLILTGTNPVYKMWFVGSQSGSATGINYAESYTAGVGTWIRYSGNPIVASSISCTIWKNAGTYYLFAGGGTTINLWTSANGVTGWTAKGAVLSTSQTGTWGLYLQIFKVIYFDGTTCYAKVDGFSSGNTIASIGIFTSVSPFTTWTAYSGNPVVSNFFGCTIPYIDSNNNYYFWSCSTANGKNLDPANAVRLKTTPPFTTWTNKTVSLNNNQQSEGVNDTHGGIYPVWLFTDINGISNYIFESWVEDSAAQETYQFSLAQSPVPMSQIVTQQEDGVMQIAYDNFSSGTGNLSANWAVPTGITRLQIVAGNLCEATVASTNCAQYYSGQFSPDQYSELTIVTMAVNAYLLPYCRMQPSGLNGYGIKLQGSGLAVGQSCQIGKTVAAVTTVIGPSETITLQVGDVLRLTAIGSSPVVLTVYQNGYQILQVQDYNNTYLTGNPGFDIYTITPLTNSQTSMWAGGNANFLLNSPGSAQLNSTSVLGANGSVSGGTILINGQASLSCTSVIGAIGTIGGILSFFDNFEGSLATNWNNSNLSLSTIQSYSPIHSVSGSSGVGYLTSKKKDGWGGNVHLNVWTFLTANTTYGGLFWRGSANPILTTSTYYGAFLAYPESLVWFKNMGGTNIVLGAIDVSPGTFVGQWMNLDVRMTGSALSLIVYDEFGNTLTGQGLMTPSFSVISSTDSSISGAGSFGLIENNVPV